MDDSKLLWNETSRKVVYHTPVFDVTERTSTGPDGQQGVYIVNETRDWVIVIPEYEGNFLMVKQWRHGEKALSIEFPGGVVDKGELPEKGAARELLEETGAVAKKLIHLGTMNPNPALFSNKVHIYLAEELEFSGKQNLDSDEFLNCMKLPVSEVLSKIGTKEYPHALMAAAAGLYLAKKNLLQNKFDSI
ncbi:MAG: NUDIX hydrolase [Treponema sp.]|nr:NUDIX hydrolase [Treponema sp.]